MVMILVEWDRKQRKLWFLRQRSHHGAWGVLCIFVGGALCVHDRRDFKDWFRLGSQR